MAGACDTASIAARVRRLRPADLLSALEAASSDAGAGPLLIDVREPREFMAGHIAGAVNIPLAELASRLRDIPVDASPVFVCRSGARSLTACGIALRAGAAEAFNLDGGLLAWAAEVDATMVLAAAR